VAAVRDDVILDTLREGPGTTEKVGLGFRKEGEVHAPSVSFDEQQTLSGRTRMRTPGLQDPDYPIVEHPDSVRSAYDKDGKVASDQSPAAAALENASAVVSSSPRLAILYFLLMALSDDRLVAARRRGSALSRAGCRRDAAENAAELACVQMVNSADRMAMMQDSAGKGMMGGHHHTTQAKLHADNRRTARRRA